MDGDSRVSTYPLQKIGNLQRKQSRAVKRYYKSMQYRAKALAGGGEREVARRKRAFTGKFDAGWTL
jgi:hypothetical protein